MEVDGKSCPAGQPRHLLVATWLNGIHPYQGLALLQELEVLLHKAELEQQEGPGPPGKSQPAADDMALNEQLQQQLRLAATALQNPRATVRDNVFRPSHQLPTISIEQQVS